MSAGVCFGGGDALITGRVFGPLPPPYLHLDAQHAGLLRQAVDVLVAQPEVSPHRAEALLVLLPVAVEGGEAHPTPLDHGPASPGGLHVAEHLEGVTHVRVFRTPGGSHARLKPNASTLKSFSVKRGCVERHR